MFLTPHATCAGLLAWTVLSLGATGCGARSSGTDGQEGEVLEVLAPSPVCAPPSECADLCRPQVCTDGGCTIRPVDCDDNDECTVDTCDPQTGRCRYAAVTEDRDGDGFRAPRAGFAPGADGSCGSDCNDLSVSAYPGGVEQCDGLDNNCDGRIDEGAVFSDPGQPPVLVSTPGVSSSLGGMSVGAGFFAFFITEDAGHQQGRIVGVNAAGQEVLPRTDVARVNSDSFAGPLAWTGASFGVAWEDRRDEAYEIYFNRLDLDGNKLNPDLRVTYQTAFSINPSLRFTGEEFALFWQDRRLGNFGIYGQRLSRNGELVGDNVLLTPDFTNAEGVRSARGTTSLGLTFNTGLEGGVYFRTVSLDLTSWSPPLQVVARGAGSPTLDYNAGSFVAAWSEYDGGPGNSIWASVISEDGAIVVPAKRIVGPGGFIRSQSLLPLGERIMVLWSEHDGNTFDIYRRFLDSELEPLSAPERVTNSEYDAIAPGGDFAVPGQLGIVYSERVDGVPRTLLKTLSCQ